MPGIVPTGFERKTSDQIFSEIVADLRDKVSDKINTQPESLVGNYTGIFASKLAEAWEVLEAVYRSTDRNSATGDALDVIGALVGTPRLPATYSTAFCTVAIGAFFSAPAGTMVASVDGNASARFVNRFDVINATPMALFLGDVEFTSELPGPVEAVSGTLTVKANPLSGWNSITNPLDAEIGTLTESDRAYRLRQLIALSRSGSTTRDAIVADVSAVDGVESVSILENTEDTTDGNGLPGHSIEVIFRGDPGSGLAVAKAIYNSKAGGIGTVGTDDHTFNDSQGQPVTISSTPAAEVEIYLDLAIDVVADQYIGDTAAKAAIAAWGQLVLTSGTDVIKQRLAALVMSLGGVYDIATIKIDDIFPAVTTTNFAITTRQIALLDTSRIVIVSTPITPS